MGVGAHNDQQTREPAESRLPRLPSRFARVETSAKLAASLPVAQSSITGAFMTDQNFKQKHLLNTTPPRSREFEIVFDGGSLGNPGKGYGSFEIMSEGEVYHHSERLEYGDHITNNQAEYMSLIEALRWLADDLGEERTQAAVAIHGDSRLVVNQINGTWKVKHANMRPLVEEARRLFREFGRCTIDWHPREKSVERLGH